MTTSYLGNKGYTVYTAGADAAAVNTWRKTLTVAPVVPRMISAKCVGESFPVYRECQSKMYLPFYYGLDLLGAPESVRLPPGDPVSLTFAGSLRDYQETIVRKYTAAIEGRPCGGGLLDVMTGSGKTVMALRILSLVGRKTLIIVHKTFLMNQWVERIGQFLPGARVGRIQGERFDVEDKDIVIGMLQSLSMKEYHATAFQSFGLLICDECHHLSAEVFVRALQRVVVPYTLGLSATMQRKDGLTKVFKWFLGPVIYKEVRSIKRVVWVKKICYISDDPSYRTMHYDNRGNPKYSTMISQLCAFFPRQDFLVDVIVRQMARDFTHSDKKQQMMVIAHNKSLLIYIHERLSSRFDGTIGYYVGGMKESALKSSESCDVILATYAMASEGLDIKTLTTMLMATPKTDVVQCIGRILRTEGHNPTLIDVVDVHDIFQSQWLKRMRYYRKEKYSVHAYTNESYLSGVLEAMSSESTESESPKSSLTGLIDMFAKDAD